MKFVRNSGWFCLLAAGAILAGTETKSSGSRATEFKSASVEQPLDLRDFIASELASGKKKLVIPPGRYRVNPTNGSHLRFQDLQNVEIVAAGLEVIFNATLQAVGFERCTNVTLRHTHGHDMTIVNGVGRIGWMTGGKSARWKDKDMADTFTKKGVQFVERERDHPLFLYFATHNIHVPRVPNPPHLGKSQCGTRGDAIVELDEAVGELLTTLKRLKLAENTLVIFSSDNGGIMDDAYEDVGNFDHSCNGASRGYKGSLFEGGHRVPFIARWPGRIEAGSDCDELITLVDLTATLAALTEQTVPPGAAIDSCNVLPALLGQPHDKPGRETFVTHVGGVAGKVPLAIRQGQWKLITEGGARPSFKDANKSNRTPLTAEDRKPFLVNLAADLSESTNVASAHPERVREMKQLLEAIIAQGRSPDGKP